MIEKYILTEDAMKRTSAVVRRGETALFGDPKYVGRQPTSANIEVLQIQAGAANAFGYPARIQQWSNSAGTWSDLSTTEVRVEDPNGTVLASTQYVNARFVGINTSDVGCFSVTGLVAASSIGYTTYNVDGVISTANQFLGAGIKRVQVLGISSYASVMTGWWDDDGPSMVNLYGLGTTAGNAGTLYVLGATDPPVSPGVLSTEPTSGLVCGPITLIDALGASATWTHTLGNYSDTTNRTHYYNGSAFPVTGVTYTSLLVDSYTKLFRLTGTRDGLGIDYYGIGTEVCQADEFWHDDGTTTYRGFSGTKSGLVFGGGILTSGTLSANLASEVTGTLPVANGGTGATSFTAGQLLAGNGTSALDSLTSTRVSGETLELKLSADRWVAFSVGSY